MSTKEVKTTKEQEKPQTSKKFACSCGKLAVWSYMPSAQSEYPHFCDDCVSRGCSCMEEYDDPKHMPILDTIKWLDKSGVLWRWKEKDKSIEHIDEKGRLLPCCEYFYFKDGIEAEQEEIEHYINKDIVFKLIE